MEYDVTLFMEEKNDPKMCMEFPLVFSVDAKNTLYFINRLKLLVLS